MIRDKGALGASPVATGLAGAEAPEPPSRLGPSDGIPSAGDTWYPRSMAPKDRRILVLCDDRAPYPVMIGQWDGAKFASTDNATSGKSWGVLGWLNLPEPGPILVYPPTCSFCGKSGEEVERLVAGPAVMICNECIALCDEVVAADAAASADTHPKDGDVKQAPLVSGAVPKADAQPSSVSPLSSEEKTS